MTNGDGDGFKIIEEKPVPDVYADSVRFEVSLWGVTLEFGQQQRAGPQGKTQPLPRLRVHMSPQHAKVMAKLFVKNMRAYEENLTPITIPKQVLDELQLEEEDG
jgi:hypothetical protein